QKAYRYFMRALLVSIFVTRVFAFVESQFGAVFGLAADVILYAAIGELASQDEQKRYRFAGLERSSTEDLASPHEDLASPRANRQTVPDGEETEAETATGPGEGADQ